VDSYQGCPNQVPDAYDGSWDVNHGFNSYGPIYICENDGAVLVQGPIKSKGPIVGFSVYTGYTLQQGGDFTGNLEPIPGDSVGSMFGRVRQIRNMRNYDHPSPYVRLGASMLIRSSYKIELSSMAPVVCGEDINDGRHGSNSINDYYNNYLYLCYAVCRNGMDMVSPFDPNIGPVQNSFSTGQKDEKPDL